MKGLWIQSVVCCTDYTLHQANQWLLAVLGYLKHDLTEL